MMYNCCYHLFLPCARFGDGLTPQTLISVKKTAKNAAKTGKNAVLGGFLGYVTPDFGLIALCCESGWCF